MDQDIICDEFERDAGRVLALRGDNKTVARLLLSMGIRSQSMARVTLIDAAGMFNPAFIHRYYKTSKVDVSKMMVARPLSSDELQRIMLRLEQTIRKHRSRVLVISGLDDLIQKDILNQNDRQFLFVSLLDEVVRVTRTLDIVTMIGLSPNSQFDRLADARCDFVARV
ncbi:hypothetical protein HY641_01970 [Candidatus Woesearchaeota archaeon]|nr:hypothetical protein [Candidatus Woesearchaeota archaeon]